MVKTSQLLLGAGVVGVVVSGVLNAAFLIESMRMVTIQVPTHTLEPYQTIGANDVTTRQVPAKALDADTLIGNLVGRVTAMTIPQGDQVQRFEIAEESSMAQVIQDLYLTHPNDAFAEIQVQDNQLSQVVQPGQHVNLTAGNIVYPDVLVLSTNNPNANSGGVAGAVSQAVNNFVSVNPSSSTQTSQPLTFLIGDPWPVVQALMSSGNTQVVMGNVGTVYSLGSPPEGQSPSPASTIPPGKTQKQQTNVAISHPGATPTVKKSGMKAGNGHGKR